jgi:arylsulfatase A-like enzyme
MNRRDFLQTSALASTTALFSHCIKSQSKKIEKPNIIFIMADDLGYGDLSCYGQEKIKTPNIDRLALEGLRFTQCYAGATVCAPSRSVLMTGQHTGHTRIRGNTCKVGGTVGYKGTRQIRRMNLLKEDITVAQVLKNAGYRTGLMGKWHIGGYNPNAGPQDRGFDEFSGPLTRTSNLHSPSYWPPKWYNNKILVDIPENQNDNKGYYRTDIITDHAIEFIKKNEENPFFLFLSYANPHSPYDAPDLGPYENQDWPLEEKTYASMIFHLDESIGKVMDLLKQSKLIQNTIVFFTSDNGPRSEGDAVQTRVIDFFNSNGPLTGYKRDMTEGGIRVPMIACWPGNVPQGQTSETVWYFADVLPTAAELAGATPPENIDGQSVLQSLLDANKEIPDRYLYWEFFGRVFQQAVRWNNWKAIRLKKDGPLLLFDLHKDIGESNNVAAENPKIVEQIETYLKTARIDSPNWLVENF